MYFNLLQRAHFCYGTFPIFIHLFESLTRDLGPIIMSDNKKRLQKNQFTYF